MKDTISYREYERRKAEIKAQNLPPREYEKAIRKLIVEMKL